MSQRTGWLGLKVPIRYQFCGDGVRNRRGGRCVEPRQDLRLRPSGELAAHSLPWVYAYVRGSSSPLAPGSLRRTRARRVSVSSLAQRRQPLVTGRARVSPRDIQRTCRSVVVQAVGGSSPLAHPEGKSC